MTDGDMLLAWMRSRGYALDGPSFVATNERGHIVIPATLVSSWFSARYPERLPVCLAAYEQGILEVIRAGSIEWSPRVVEESR